MANYVTDIEEYLAQFKRSNYTDLWAIQALIARATELERSIATGSNDFTPVKTAKKAPPKKKVKSVSDDSSSLSDSENDESEDSNDSSSASESEKEEKPAKKRAVPAKKKMPKKKAVAKTKRTPFINNAGSEAGSSDSESEEERAPRMKKIKKDPNAPKRNRTAYLFFAEDKRAIIRQQYPDLKLGQLMMQMGTMWKEMTDTERQPYVEKAAQDRIRYETEMAQYTAMNSTATHVRKEAKEIEPPAPADNAKSSVKRPMSAYMIYCQQNRAAVKQSRPDVTFGELGMIMANQWREFSDADKQVYNDQAQKDKERYQREMGSM